MNIYFSRSKQAALCDDFNLNLVYEFTAYLKTYYNITSNIYFHRLGTSYEPSKAKLHQADLVVLGVKESTDDYVIGRGCYTELEYAANHNIPIITIREYEETHNFPFPWIEIVNFKNDVSCIKETNDWNKWANVNLSFEYCYNTKTVQSLYALQSKHCFITELLQYYYNRQEDALKYAPKDIRPNSEAVDTSGIKQFHDAFNAAVMKHLERRKNLLQSEELLLLR